jgi:hypothetical protein
VDVTRLSRWGLLALLLCIPSLADAQGVVRLAALTSDGTFDGDGDTVTLETKGHYGTAVLDIAGAIGGGSTITFSCLGDFDGSTWSARPLNGPYPATTEDTDGAVTTTGQYSANIAGCQKIRAVASAWGTGSPTVTLTASTAGGGAATSGGGSTFNGVLLDAAAGDAITDTANNALRVNVVTGGGTGGTSVNEDVASADAHPGTPAYTVRNNTLTGATSLDGDYQPMKSTAAGATYVAPTFGDTVASTGTGASGAQTQRVVTATDSTIGTVTAVTTVSTVTNVATIGTSVTPGTAAANLGKAEDAVAGSADTGVMALAVRANAPAATGANGDYVPLLSDTNGRLHTATVLYNEAGTALTPATDVTEDAAETAGGTGPMVLNVRRDTAASSAGTSGDNATFNTDGLGRLWTRPANPCQDHARLSNAVISSSASGNVEIVALNGSDLIYVCSVSVVAGAATGVQLIYGTGTACATGETDMTGVWSFAANGGIALPNSGAPQFVVPAGNAFCFENSGANAVAGHVAYVRTAAP